MTTADKKCRYTRVILIVAWIGVSAAAAALVAGHLGAHELRWVHNQISTYAARAPNAHWITSGMSLSALVLVCLGIGISLNRFVGTAVLGRIAAMMFGVAAAGLLMLAYFKETAMSLRELKQLGFEAVRQQTFHDAGLLAFFYGVIVAMAVSGAIVTWEARGWAERMLGSVIGAIGLLAWGAMALPWPEFVGIAEGGFGARQRAAFLCFWVGALLLLGWLTKRAAVTLAPRRDS